MKIQIDTDRFEIKIEDRNIKLNDLFNVLENLLPNDQWKEYSLIQDRIITWINPINYPNWIYGDPNTQNPYYIGDLNTYSDGSGLININVDTNSKHINDEKI